MANYLIKRLLLMIPTLFGILVISFIVIKLAPGDPASLKYGGVGQAAAGLNADRGTESAEKVFRERWAFDQPLHIQFVKFLNRLAHGDLVSFQKNQPIWGELWAALKITVIINSIVFVLIYVAAIPLGIISAANPNSPTDRITTVLLFIMYSLPSFWVAEILRMLFMGWLPILNLTSRDFDSMTTWQQLQDYAHHIVLPVICMTYGGLAYVSRQMRAGMLEVIRQDYIRTAEAKGAGRSRVILVHALRNSLFPVITLLASLLPFLVGGSVIIEVIFQIPGMGLLSYRSMEEREYDMVLMTLMLSAVLTLLGILISDILYVVVNPRVTFENS
ncbi:MAG: binding-protein-dependent transport system inner rane component [Schlesneria sp.]|nr:binding-protein-dependent transport system inner rane component [Schlesneria sp.]